MASVRINPLEDPPDFSIVLGGPLFQLLRRAHLGGDHLELLNRRLIIFVGITWLPLFLLALPAFIAAELLIHSRMLPVARRFVERRLILSEDLPRFYGAVESAF